MSRTTSAAVKAILGDNYDLVENPPLQQFIDTASAIVARVRTCATAKGYSLSSPELELVERWLAAHCYVQMDQTYASKSTEGASASFHGQTGMYLESSKYGQMALNLDPSGCLAAIGKGQRASLFWAGREVPRIS